jgi:hypothetical protein
MRRNPGRIARSLPPEPHRQRREGPTVDRSNPESEPQRLPGSHPVGLAALDARVEALRGALCEEPLDGDAEAPGAIRLEISPLNLFQSVAVWRSLRPRRARTLVLSGSLDERLRERRAEEALAWLRRESIARLGRCVDSLDESAGAWGLPSMLLLEDTEFEWVADTLPWKRFEAVRIEGEVEAADALAIRRTIAGGGTALDGDLRALAGLCLRPDGGAQFLARSLRPLAAIVAEDLAFYLAAVLRCGPESVSRPAASQVGRLLACSGRILVRPEETDIFERSIDIGVSTAREGEHAADRSLIYDLPSDSWHDE